MNDVPKWITKPMVWQRFDYSDVKTYPPYGIPVLWVDEIHKMVVAYLDHSHDIILSTSSVIVDCLLCTGDYEDMEKQLESAVAEIHFPLAWMSLPPPPVQIVPDGEVNEEAVMRAADIMDELEPVLRDLINAKLSGAFRVEAG